ncbi:MAG TPA: hypothetical protein DEV98_01700 [Clostridiales bacterium]|nr:hypothetical protein [Clostridiales bacterium]
MTFSTILRRFYEKAVPHGNPAKKAGGGERKLNEKRIAASLSGCGNPDISFRNVGWKIIFLALAQE